MPVVQRNTRRPRFAGRGPSPGYTETPGGERASPGRSRRADLRVPEGGAAPQARMHSRPTPASPARGAGRGPELGSQRRELPAGRASARERALEHWLPGGEAPPLAGPAHRFSRARARRAPRRAVARACAGRALGGEASPGPRINPSRARPPPRGPGPPGSVPARAGGAPPPQPAPRMHGERGGAAGGVHDRRDGRCSCRRRGCCRQGRARLAPHPAPCPNSKKKS